MSQTALIRFGAETGQATDDHNAWEAELRAGFDAFGDKPASLSWSEFGLWTGPENPKTPDFAAFGLPALPANDRQSTHSSALTRYIPQRAPAPDLTAKRVRLDPRIANVFLRAVDWLVVLAAAELTALWSASASLATLAFGDAAAIVICALSLKAGLWLTDAYRTEPREQCPEHDSGGLALGAILGLVVSTLLAPSARAAGALSTILPLAGLVLAGVHAAFAIWIKALHRKGAFADQIVLVGATDAAQRFIDRAVKTGDAHVVAVFDDRLARAPTTLGDAPVCGGVDDLINWPSLPHVDRIVIAVPYKAETRIRALLESLRGLPQRIDLLLDYRVESVRGRSFDRLAEAPLARVSGVAPMGGGAALKRAQDLILGTFLAVAFAPLMALVALAVKLSSPGPIIFRQRRHGFNNRIITIYKFRTMRHEIGAPLKQVTANDPRVTRIGALLRRTSLDELPQLFNVLKGEMSLVGPRPHAVGMRAANRDLSQIVAEYAHRHRVKPGLTGWAQINGSRGPIETPKAVRERVRLDLEYVQRASPWFDLWILLRTAPALLGDRKATR